MGSKVKVIYENLIGINNRKWFDGSLPDLSWHTQWSGFVYTGVEVYQGMLLMQCSGSSSLWFINNRNQHIEAL